jgi:hypothetical protein
MPKMKELIEAGLFGRGLIPVDNSVLVKRYNACLKDMGLEPTKLETFQIDQVGWSPEIAAEKNDEYYLSHGDANPLAIIIVPEQARAPIYFPYHSFDWDLMRQWFTTHKPQVPELTRQTGIWLDIDQEVELYQEPEDLLMVSEVIVRPHTPCGLIGKAIHQQDLVHRFLREEESYLDPELIEAIVKSRQEVGDLRKRMVIIRDYQFSNVPDFYSRAFGGVFVLRSLNAEPLVICRKPQIAKKHGLLSADSSVLPVLEKHGYMARGSDWWKDNLYQLRIIAESFLMEVLDKEEPDCKFVELNSAEQKAVIKKHGNKLSTYLELQRIIRAFEQGRDRTKMPTKIAELLVHPAEGIEGPLREVVWQLITFIRGGRLIPFFYRHQKSAFVEAYTKEWKTPRCSWALRRIREHYDLASKSSGGSLT